MFDPLPEFASRDLVVSILPLLVTNPFHMISQLLALPHGTTVNMLPSDALDKPSFVVPARDLVAEHSTRRFSPMLSRHRLECTKSTETLAELRDALLPRKRWIGGEIRVGEAEEDIVEAQS